MKIFIVDDEPIVRQYIESCISAAVDGAEVVGSFTSAGKALESLKEDPPDLVLADIIMPKMDGLELLRRIHEYDQRIHVIMLTCHEEFDFVREAMKNGAENYLLKSEIDETLLRRVLREVGDKLDAEKKRALDFAAQTAYVRRLLDGGTEEENTEQDTFLLRDAPLMAFGFLNTQENLYRVREHLPECVEQPVLYQYNARVMMLLCNVKNVQGSKVNMLPSVVQEQFAEVATGLHGIWGQSMLYFHLAQLPAAIEDAQNEMCLRFYEADERTSESREESLLRMENDIMQISALIRGGRFSSGVESVYGLMQFAKQTQVDVVFLKNSVIQLLQGFAKHTDFILPKIESSITEALTFREMEDAVRQCFGAMQLSERKYSEAVRKALGYLEKHYMEDVSLNSTADHVFLNRDYFSRQFKKEVGVNFSEYLTQIRMQRAADLLCTTEERVSDVALRVGISNMSYFSTVFHKIFGKTPNEYRKDKTDMSKM